MPKSEHTRFRDGHATVTLFKVSREGRQVRARLGVWVPVLLGSQRGGLGHIKCVESRGPGGKIP